MSDKLNIYWMTIDILFSSPMPIYGQDGESSNDFAYGAIMELGVTAQTEDSAKNHVASMIASKTNWDRDNYSIEYDRVGVIEGNEIHSEIYSDDEIKESLIRDPNEEGIWYKTGFGFYNSK